MHIKNQVDGSGDALWKPTAVTEPKTQILNETRHCDVAIVGAGFTGLNAALRLAKSGKSVCVLEKNHLGFGASGRSGGQVNLGLNLGPGALIDRFGVERAIRLIDLVINTPKRVFDLIRSEGLDCDAVQNGWVQGAITPKVAGTQEAMAREYSAHGYEFELLDKAAVEERTGSSLYAAGLFCDVAGFLHPLSYTHELARVAIGYGARVYTDSPVVGIDRNSEQWRLESPQGSVVADQVLVCTNGYTEPDTGQSTQSLHKKVIPVRSLLMATEPLSDNLRQTVLPNQVTFVDKRRLILYARYDRDGRLCIGDRGPMRDRFVDSDFTDVKARVVEVFPQLAGTRWDYQWGGRIAVTKDSLPFVCEIAPGLVAALGYNGRGVGMGSVMGQTLADNILNGSFDESVFPVTQPKSFLMHRFKDVGVATSIKWFALLDYLESR